MPQTLNK